MQTKIKEVVTERIATSPIDKHLGIIGAGYMGSALLKGVINSKLIMPKKVIACDIDPAKLQKLASDWKIHTTMDLNEVAKEAEILLFCVKPQVIKKVLENSKKSIRQDHLVISIVAGTKISFIQSLLESKVGVVRAMPNIAVTVSEGATALAFGDDVNEEQKKMARSIFEATGEVVVVEEKLMDAVTGLSGSGPAYICTIIEALIDGGVKVGLSRDVATRLAIQTLLGSARLIKALGVHPAVLRDQITTPGGTTICGIHEMEKQGLRGIIMDAVVSATRRSEELSKILSDVNH